MSPERTLPVFVRCYVENPGGAYDPAPLPEFDHHSFSPPAVGDRLQEGRTGNVIYVVKQRHFHIHHNGGANCALLIERAPPGALDRV